MNVDHPINKELVKIEVAKLLARAGLLQQQIYEIPEESLGKACFDALQQADSYLLKHSDGMMLAALPCVDGSIRFTCLLKAGIMDCWIMVTEQSPNSPLRAAVNDMIEDLIACDMILPDYSL